MQGFKKYIWFFFPTLTLIWGGSSGCQKQDEPISGINTSTGGSGMVRMLSREIFDSIRLSRCIRDNPLQEVPIEIAQKIEKIRLPTPLDEKATDDLKDRLPQVKEVYLTAGPTRAGGNPLTLPPQVKSLIADMSRYHAQGNIEAVIGNLVKGNKTVDELTVHLRGQDSAATLLEAADEFLNIKNIVLKVDRVDDPHVVAQFMKKFRQTQPLFVQKFPHLERYRLEIYKDNTGDIYIEDHKRQISSGTFDQTTFGDWQK